MGTNTSGLRPPWKKGESGRSHARRPIINRKSIIDQRVTTLEARVNALADRIAAVEAHLSTPYTIAELEDKLRGLGVVVEVVD